MSPEIVTKIMPNFDAINCLRTYEQRESPVAQAYEHIGAWCHITVPSELDAGTAIPPGGGRHRKTGCMHERKFPAPVRGFSWLQASCVRFPGAVGPAGALLLALLLLGHEVESAPDHALAVAVV